MDTTKLTKQQFLELMTDQTDILFDLFGADGTIDYVFGCRTLAEVMEETNHRVSPEENKALCEEFFSQGTKYEN